MRNLEDRPLHKAVERTMAGFRAAGLNVRPALGSAVKAYMEAANHPDSLVRVTATAEEEMVLFDSLVSMDRAGRNKIDWMKTVKSTDEHPELELLIEFRNGSGIELVRHRSL